MPEIDREGDRLAKTKGIKLEGLLALLLAIGLVGAQYHWFARPSQQVGDLAVGRADAVRVHRRAGQ